MKGDFTRTTFRADKHYRSVRMQQGRVQLDADWNEQGDIDAHRADTHAADVVGPSGGSFGAGGFAIAASAAALPASQRDDAAPLPPLEANDFLVSAGRYYVGGLACENERPVSYSQQPDLPKPIPPQPGKHLVYLDVWEQHVTAIEDPDIREVALGGPDTATRTKLVWQVRLFALPGNNAAAIEARAAFASLTALKPGRLAARAQPTVASDEPCAITPGAGYRSLENQLYRVEIHRPGDLLGHATFKWSRDNGSVVTAWLGHSGNELRIESSGRDNTLAFQVGEWVELTDDSRELRGEPGILVKLTGVASQTLTLTTSELIDYLDFPRNPKVRRWNTVSASGERLVEVPATNDGYLDIEDGVQVRFADGTYSTGDYWLIPARSALGTVEWPKAPDDLLPPHGPTHRYAPLAVVEYDGSALTVLADLRSRFPATTELASLFAIAGNGQQAAPGQTLAQPLIVGVAGGQWPVESATVRFEVTAGSGMLDGSAQRRDLVTGPNGLASCRWTLGSDLGPQEVTATLLDSSEAPIHLPVRFHATLGTTSIDAAVRVKAVTLADGTAIDNDAEIPGHRLAEGLQVRCDGRVADASISESTVAVTLELPWPLTTPDQGLWGGSVVGYLPITLKSRTTAQPGFIEWVPRGPAGPWLETSLFEALEKAGQDDPVLAWLRLQGNFIWSHADSSVLLDGEAFGRPSGTTVLPQIGMTLPSGDGRRGGVFAMWFWLVDVTVTISLEASEARPLATVGVTVVVTGAANKAVTVTASPGTIKPGATDGAFVYTAPKVTGIPLPPAPGPIDTDPDQERVATITATSVIDPTRSDTKTIVLLGPLGR